jgi:hypothetical protein
MAGDDRVRHCAECNRNVYNFAELTRAEIDELVATSEGRLCARLYRRADGTMITKDCPVGLQIKVRRISRVAGAALSAALTAIPVAAQTPAPNQPTSVQLERHVANLAVEVKDPSGAAIPNASVTLIDSTTNAKTEQPTNASGWAKLVNLQPGRYRIHVAAPGFLAATEHVTLSAGEHVGIETRLNVVIVGEVIEVDTAARKTQIPNSYFQSDESNPPGQASGVRKILRKLHL